MNTSPLISVVIPSFNSARYIAHAVRSAQEQTYSPVEIIVVDDGSTDETTERLALWKGDIRYIYQPNGGPSRARNRGIREARGELIAFLDADDLWQPEKLARQWEVLRKNPEIGLVHTDVCQLYEPEAVPVYVDRNRQRFSGSCYSVFFEGNRVHTSTVLVTRRCLERVGSFDESIRTPSTEDLDLWLRIARYYPLGYVHEPLVFYRHHETNGSLDPCAMVENEYYVLTKALKDDGAPGESLDLARIRRRLSELAFEAGYANVNADRLRRARHYFGEALVHTHVNPKAFAFWASTFLSPTLRRALRAGRHRLSPADLRNDGIRATDGSKCSGTP